MTLEPVVLEQRVEPPRAELVLSIPPELQYFAGHFPAAPVVPGVVQLKWAVEAARRLLGVSGIFAAMENLKFQRVLVPDAVATLTLEWAAADRKLYFSYEHGDVRFSGGRLLFRSAT